MAFLENLSKKASNAFQATAQKTKELADTTKTNMAISAEEEQIRKSFTKLGEAYFKYAETAEGLPEDLKVHIDAILTARVKIAELKQKIAIIKDEAICTNCGTKVSRNVRFCPSCGNGIEEKQLVDEISSQQTAEEAGIDQAIAELEAVKPQDAE